MPLFNRMSRQNHKSWQLCTAIIVVHRQQEPTTGHNENSLGSTKSGTYILT